VFVRVCVSGVATAGAGAVADEAISNVRTVQAFGAEDRETARYSLKLNDAMLLGMRSGLINGATLGLTMGILFGSYGLSLWCMSFAAPPSVGFALPPAYLCCDCMWPANKQTVPN
jgi:hypothetical protein